MTLENQSPGLARPFVTAVGPGPCVKQIMSGHPMRVCASGRRSGFPRRKSL
jgi:hypothetical protein